MRTALVSVECNSEWAFTRLSQINNDLTCKQFERKRELIALVDTHGNKVDYSEKVFK